MVEPSFSPFGSAPKSQPSKKKLFVQKKKEEPETKSKQFIPDLPVKGKKEGIKKDVVLPPSDKTTLKFEGIRVTTGRHRPKPSISKPKPEPVVEKSVVRPPTPSERLLEMSLRPGFRVREPTLAERALSSKILEPHLRPPITRIPQKVELKSLEERAKEEIIPRAKGFLEVAAFELFRKGVENIPRQFPKLVQSAGKAFSSVLGTAATVVTVGAGAAAFSDVIGDALAKKVENEINARGGLSTGTKKSIRNAFDKVEDITTSTPQLARFSTDAKKALELWKSFGKSVNDALLRDPEFRKELEGAAIAGALSSQLFKKSGAKPKLTQDEIRLKREIFTTETKWKGLKQEIGKFKDAVNDPKTTKTKLKNIVSKSGKTISQIEKNLKQADRRITELELNLKKTVSRKKVFTSFEKLKIDAQKTRLNQFKEKVGDIKKVFSEAKTTFKEKPRIGKPKPKLRIETGKPLPSEFPTPKPKILVGKKARILDRRNRFKLSKKGKDVIKFGEKTVKSENQIKDMLKTIERGERIGASRFQLNKQSLLQSNKRVIETGRQISKFKIKINKIKSPTSRRRFSLKFEKLSRQTKRVENKLKDLTIRLGRERQKIRNSRQVENFKTKEISKIAERIIQDVASALSFGFISDQKLSQTQKQQFKLKNILEEVSKQEQKNEEIEKTVEKEVEEAKNDSKTVTSNWFKFQNIVLEEPIKPVEEKKPKKPSRLVRGTPRSRLPSLPKGKLVSKKKKTKDRRAKKRFRRTPTITDILGG